MQRYFTVLVFLLLSTRCVAVEIPNYNSAVHDRFQASANGDSLWSGVAQTELSGGSFSYWVTMISDTYYLSATHNAPPPGARPHFYRTDNPNTSTVWSSATVVDGYAIPNSGGEDNKDIWVGRLSTAPPAWVKRYPLLIRRLHASGQWENDTFAGLTLIGRTAQNIAENATNMRIVTGSGYTGSIFNMTVSGNWTFPDFGGDSGGPSFTMVGGVPVLTGIHSQPNVDINVANFVGEIEDEVNDGLEDISIASEQIGDTNGDYDADSGDLQTVTNSLFLQNARFSDGDVNLDGTVDGSDWNIVNDHLGEVFFQPADFDENGIVNRADLKTLGQNMFSSSATKAMGDADGNGVVNQLDIDIWFENIHQRVRIPPTDPRPDPNPVIFPEDLNMDGRVGNSDALFVITHWGQAISDVTGDGIGDAADHAQIINHGSFQDPYSADTNGDLLVDEVDMEVLVIMWAAQASPGPPVDLDGVPGIDYGDFDIFVDWIGVGAP